MHTHLAIGSYSLGSGLLLAPMAGITDLPFRRLCKTQGATHAVTEMISADGRLWDTLKSRKRRDYTGERPPHWVQILGSDPAIMGDAARRLCDEGAHIIDINMGCPVRKVRESLSGAMLLADERRLVRILETVINKVDIPVTIKMRLGIDKSHINAVRVATIAQQCGVAAITVHGRTLACGYAGQVDYAAIAEVNAAVSIPVIANGDITTAQDAKKVLHITGADALMVGRGACGKPWLFGQIEHFLQTGQPLPAPNWPLRSVLIVEHIQAIHQFYGSRQGVLQARKHIKWYLQEHLTALHIANLLALPDASSQLCALKKSLDTIMMCHESTQSMKE